MTSWARSPPFSPIRLAFHPSESPVTSRASSAFPNYQPPVYPEGWEDDRLMAIRFADAPSADIDPEGHAAHINWWLEAMRLYSSQNGTLHISHDEIIRHFNRQGMYPECIPDVMRKLVDNGQLSSVPLFLKPPNFLTNIWAYVASGITQVFLKNSGSTPLGPYFFVDVAKERAAELLETLLSSTFNEVDRILDFNQIKALVASRPSTDAVVKNLFESNASRVDLDAQILLRQLAADNKIATFYGQANTMFAKITSSPHSPVQPVSESDRSIANLKYTMQYLVEHLAILEAKRTEKMAEVRAALRNHSKTLAKYHLAGAKALEKEENTRSQQLHNLQGLLLRISSSHSNREVFGAMKQASQAVIQIQRECGLDAESAGDFMAELEETLADASELDQALSQDVTGGEDMNDLEDELELLDSMQEQQEAFATEYDLPSVPRMDAVKPVAEAIRANPNIDLT